MVNASYFTVMMLPNLVESVVFSIVDYMMSHVGKGVTSPTGNSLSERYTITENLIIV